MNPELGTLRHEEDSPYLAGLGLLSEPFADTPAEHFFYADADGEQRLDLLLHLAPYSPLLVIVGKPGVGKTALLQQFAARANTAWRVAAVTVRDGMSGDELLREMVRGFGLLLDNRAGHQALYAALVAQLRALRQTAQSPVLLLDDAQHLSAEMLELIRKLCEENDAGHFLSLILFGTPQLQNALEGPGLAPLAARVSHTFEVTPFTEEGTAAYIRHRLQAAGAGGDGPFDSALINKIHADSGGVAARINELAWQLMLDKAVAKERKGGAAASAGTGFGQHRAVLMAAAVVAVLLIAIIPLRTALFKPGPPAPDKPRQSQDAVSPPPVAVGEGERIVRSLSGETPLAGPDATASPAAEVKPLPLPSVPATAQEPPRAETTVSAGVPASSSDAPPAASPPKSPAKPEAAKVVAAKPKAPAAVSAKGEIHGAEWVRAQPEDHYTLQLMALKEETTARQFIETNHLQDKAAYFTARRDGQLLYVLVYGVYANHSEAARAAKGLPAKWGTPNPWVRSFKDLRVGTGN